MCEFIRMMKRDQISFVFHDILSYEFPNVYGLGLSYNLRNILSSHQKFFFGGGEEPPTVLFWWWGRRDDFHLSRNRRAISFSKDTGDKVSLDHSCLWVIGFVKKFNQTVLNRKDLGL